MPRVFRDFPPSCSSSSSSFSSSFRPEWGRGRGTSLSKLLTKLALNFITRSRNVTAGIYYKIKYSSTSKVIAHLNVFSTCRLNTISCIFAFRASSILPAIRGIKLTLFENRSLSLSLSLSFLLPRRGMERKRRKTSSIINFRGSLPVDKRWGGEGTATLSNGGRPVARHVSTDAFLSPFYGTSINSFPGRKGWAAAAWSRFQSLGPFIKEVAHAPCNRAIILPILRGVH